MNTISKKTYVFIWIDNRYVPCGILKLTDKGVFTFGYGLLYKKMKKAIALDPIHLPLTYDGIFRDKKLFGIFRNAASDKWGRKILGALQNIYYEELDDFDVLTAFHSQARIGALAFGEGPVEPSSLVKRFSPYQCDISEIEKYAEIIQIVDELSTQKEIELFRKDAVGNAFAEALAGSLSVGGARPKLLVSSDGALWIAKFPKRGDVWNEPRIEHATMKLARRCGLSVASTRLLSFSSVDVLLVQRFDRKNGIPQHFMSAMTLKGLAEDGDWSSYQAIADTLRRYGGGTDYREIFRRMVFNGLVANYDDHPRNHAFFVTQNGIRITPAYDIVPSFYGMQNRQSALICGKYGRTASLENYLSDTGRFGLTLAEANKIVTDMVAVVMQWQNVFREHGVSDSDMERLERRILRCGDHPVEEKVCRSELRL